jgi:D-psicose/D-tagatose/L-ribulose 3-epimerase
MEIGINLMLWTARPGLEHAQLCANLRAIGYDLVELPIFEPGAFPALAMQRMLADAGLGVTCSGALPSGASLVSDQPAETQRARDYLVVCIDVCAALGARILCGPLYHPVGAFTGAPPTGEERRRFVEHILPVADYAAAAGVCLAIEPLNRFETHFLNTLADGAAIVRTARHPALRLMADTFHQHIEETSLAEALLAAGDVLCHIHASENHRGCPGRGQVRWAELARALRDMEYGGAVVVESFGAALPELAAATRIWRDIAGDPLKLAADAWLFTRDLLSLEK